MQKNNSTRKDLTKIPDLPRMQEATKEGAAKLTPETLAWANKRYAEDLSVIENNRHNSELVNKASADANQSATRLLKMVRNAKGSSAKNPEQMAKQIEKNELATDQAAQDKVQSTALIADYKNQLATSAPNCFIVTVGKCNLG